MLLKLNTPRCRHAELHRPRYLLPGLRQRDQHESQSLNQQPKGWNANQSIVKPIPNFTQYQLMMSNLLGLQYLLRHDRLPKFSMTDSIA